MAQHLARGQLLRRNPYRATGVKVKLDDNVLELNHHMVENRILINLVQAATVKAGQLFEIEINT